MNPSPSPGDSGAISTQGKESNQRRLKNQTLVLALGALGVVYGDIGTSPLYAIKECFHGHHAIALTPGNIYFGQGAILYPMVGLSTIATVIASQALISGVFSLTQQAIELGFCPRFVIVHTSSIMRGQIYMPAVNYALMIACLGVVIGFGESSGLAAAYFGLPANRVVELGVQIQL